MKIKFDCTGNKRKELVAAIGELLEKKPEYKGAPTFSYNIDGFVVDKNGTLAFDDRTDRGVVEKLIEKLAERGFEFEVLERDTTSTSSIEGQKLIDPQDGISGLVIEMPRDTFTQTALENLNRLIESKEELIKKALGVETLSVETTDEKVRFPWFSFPLSAEEVKAYTHFISSFCEMARKQKRITAQAKETKNEKYAFRCFLLRLGFIGAEFKSERKILLSKLNGNAAFKSGSGSHRPEGVPKV